MSKFKERTRVVGEFRTEEYDRFRDLLFGRLERRLKRWDADQVELELSVKERDTSSQRTVLECWIAGLPARQPSLEPPEQQLPSSLVLVGAELRDDPETV